MAIPFSHLALRLTRRRLRITLEPNAERIVKALPTQLVGNHSVGDPEPRLSPVDAIFTRRCVGAFVSLPELTGLALVCELETGEGLDVMLVGRYTLSVLGDGGFDCVGFHIAVGPCAGAEYSSVVYSAHLRGLEDGCLDLMFYKRLSLSI